MASASDGKVVIDTHLNNKGFTKGIAGMKSQMGGLTSVVKRLGATIASVFAVRALVNFGKECVELGSNVAEVQNVVDVAFGEMSYKVEAFADTSIERFGMSALAAKKTASTYMAMAKGMGIADDAASDMAITLAGLSGDVASFYNISQELADTKLKSVFTGETETLKELGVVMTQANLEAYALKQGITKSMDSMSQAEKVALRYNYVLDSLALAQGDFARTSDSWANQTRVLKMQWEEFMSIIGQSLITVLTPCVKVLNQIVSGLISVASSINTVVSTMFGVQQTASSVSGSISDSVDAQDALTDSTEETAKAQKKLLAGFDEINKIGSEDSSSDDSSALGNIPTYGTDTTPVTKVDDNPAALQFFERVRAAVQPTIDAVGRLWEQIKKLGGFTGGALIDFYNNFLVPVGTWVLGVGLPMLIDSIANGLALINWESINGGLSTLWSILGSLPETVGESLVGLSAPFEQAWADIAALGSPISGWISADFIPLVLQFVSTITNTLMGLWDTVGMIFSDLWSVVILPTVQKFAIDIVPFLLEFVSQTLTTLNTLFDGVKGIFDRIWQTAIAPALGMVVSIWNDAWDSVLAAWEKWGAPIFEKVRTAIQNTSDTLSNIWETIIRPVWEKIMAVVDQLWTEHLKPLWDNFLDFVGVLVDGALDIYNGFILPVVNWFTKNLGPTISEVIGTAIDVVGSLIGGIVDHVSFIIDVLKGMVDFIVGIFTGDWKRAWQGVKDIFVAEWNAIKNFFETIVDAITKLAEGIADIFNIGDVTKYNPDFTGYGPDYSWMFKNNTKLPGLATGAVVPPNREFMAVLGDNKKETEVVSPLSTMKQAMLEALRESGGAGGRQITIVLEVDRREFGRAVYTANNEESQRVGVSLVGV